MTFDDKAPAESGAEDAETGAEDTDQQQQRHIPQRHGIRRSLLEVFDAPPSGDKRGGGLEEDPGRRLLSLMRDMYDARTARAWLRCGVARRGVNMCDMDLMFFSRQIVSSCSLSLVRGRFISSGLR